MENKKLIFVSGFMGCGKTTQGKKLAKEIGYHFIDLDEYIANKYDNDITELFKEIGEPEFRKIETASLLECINDNMKTIIALGGGTPCFNDNINVLLNSGTLIYLKMSDEELYQRLFKETSSRPLIINKVTDELFIYIKDLLAKREVFYAQAPVIANGNDYTVDNLKALLATCI
jgi:shikimate kinase